MKDFFRFPRTSHLAWLGDGMPRDDKVLSPGEVTTLLAGAVVVEEKLDGANVGLSLAPGGGLRAQNRGQYLADPHAGQFARLPAWMAQHEEGLRRVIRPNLILFGEWCAARHSLNYTKLPDWFLLFDVYDRAVGRFWSTPRRNELASSAGLVTVPRLFHGKTSVAALKQVIAELPSQFRTGPLEGVVVRRESSEWCDARAKLVRPDFAQAIDTHWRRRSIEWNRQDFHFEQTRDHSP